VDFWVWIVIAAVVVIALILLAAGTWSSRRRAQLRERFGPEYDRRLASADRRRDAERELRERAARRDELDVRPLSPSARSRFEQRWGEIQSGFIDRPPVAVAEADELVTEVMRERGYPVDDFDEQSDLVSVDHPDVVEHYRNGHAIYARTTHGTASTEDVRQAVLCYRSLFEELVHDEPARDSSETS
jgi:hypothetical protein